MLRHRFTLSCSVLLLALGVVAWLGCSPSETAENSPTPDGESSLQNDNQQGHSEHPVTPKVANVDTSTPDAAGWSSARPAFWA